MKPQCARILADLADHEWHSAGEWMNLHPPIIAVSQRIGDLRRAGYDIASTGRGGHALATYRLPAVPDVDAFAGALFEVRA